MVGLRRHGGCLESSCESWVRSRSNPRRNGNYTEKYWLNIMVHLIIYTLRCLQWDGLLRRGRKKWVCRYVVEGEGPVWGRSSSFFPSSFQCSGCKWVESQGLGTGRWAGSQASGIEVDFSSCGRSELFAQSVVWVTLWLGRMKVSHKVALRDIEEHRARKWQSSSLKVYPRSKWS